VLGADYEYGLTEMFGVGGFADLVLGADRSLAIGAQAYLHLEENFALIAGPGVERVHDQWGAIFRVGASYEIELDTGYTLAPTVFYDFTEYENVVQLGVNVGKTF
jgi:hypothetical protein